MRGSGSRDGCAGGAASVVSLVLTGRGRGGGGSDDEVASAGKDKDGDVPAGNAAGEAEARLGAEIARLLAE
ncbi:hypothetical protein ACFRCW_36575 [Streptomyces sp. NPDC056653]|uniref:hypothetical protein n=1 Tax=Streptomyces sp. NPDC056653 TaxID=3345894 RepID=UPI0036A1B605